MSCPRCGGVIPGEAVMHAYPHLLPRCRCASEIQKTHDERAAAAKAARRELLRDRRQRGGTAVARKRPMSNPAPAGKLDHKDLCRLARAFNAASVGDEQDRRISEWLKAQIEAALDRIGA